MTTNDDDSTRQRSRASEEAAERSGAGRSGADRSGPSSTKAEKAARKLQSALDGQASVSGRGSTNRRQRSAAGDEQRPPQRQRSAGGSSKGRDGRGAPGDRESDGLGGRAPTGPSGQKQPSGTKPNRRVSRGETGSASGSRRRRRPGSRSNPS